MTGDSNPNLPQKQPLRPMGAPLPAIPVNNISGEQALAALIYAQGKPALAAERLGLQDADTLLAAMVMDEAIHEKMRIAMRAFTLIRLLGVAESLEDTLMERIDDLETKEVAKLFASVLTLADLMTRGPAGGTTNINIQETLLRVLPPEVRHALRVVQGNSMDSIMHEGPAA